VMLMPSSSRSTTASFQTARFQPHRPPRTARCSSCHCCCSRRGSFRFATPFSWCYWSST
jgi:hypothetical protein